MKSKDADRPPRQKGAPRQPDAGRQPGAPRPSLELEEGAPEPFERCPFLGTKNGPDTALPFASEEHRCFSASIPVPISMVHQRKYCLTAQYGLCPVYREKMGAVLPAESAPAPAPTPVIPPTVSPARDEIKSDIQETAPLHGEQRIPWLDPSDDMLTEMSALFGVGLTPPESPPVPSGNLPVFQWEMEVHPDFIAAEGDPLPRPQFYRNPIVGRLLIALLLLALIPTAWWLFSHAPERPGFLPGGDSIQGVGLAPMAPANGGDDAGNGLISGSSTATPTGQAAPISEASEIGVVVPIVTRDTGSSLIDLEQIALTATALFADATMVTECVAPSWWVSYVIEKGDTIESLARSRGIQRELLIVANCLTQSDLEVGRTIFLPSAGVIDDETIEAPPALTAPVMINPTRPPMVSPTLAPVQVPTATAVIIIIPTALPTAVPPPPAPTTAPPPPTDMPEPPPAPTNEPPPLPPEPTVPTP